jgi:hypothetical protein
MISGVLFERMRNASCRRPVWIRVRREENPRRTVRKQQSHIRNGFLTQAARKIKTKAQRKMGMKVMSKNAAGNIYRAPRIIAALP